MFKQFEKDATRKNKQIIAKIKKQRTYFKIQLIVMKKGKK